MMLRLSTVAPARTAHSAALRIRASLDARRLPELALASTTVALLAIPPRSEARLAAIAVTQVMWPVLSPFVPRPLRQLVPSALTRRDVCGTLDSPVWAHATYE